MYDEDYDWSHFDQDEGGDEDMYLDFDPITRTKDPFAEDDAIEGDSDGGVDKHDDEDQLFEGHIRAYQVEPEMELGFPEHKQEYEAEGCLNEVEDEYNQYERGRNLKAINRGAGVALYDDNDFFAREVEGDVDDEDQNQYDNWGDIVSFQNFKVYNKILKQKNSLEK